MGVLDDEFTPGTTQATTPVTPGGPSTPSTVTADASSSSSTFTVSTTPTAIDASSSSSSSTSTATTPPAEIDTPEIPAEEKKPTFTIKGNAAARGIGNVDPRLVAIMDPLDKAPYADWFNQLETRHDAAMAAMQHDLAVHPLADQTARRIEHRHRRLVA